MKFRTVNIRVAACTECDTRRTLRVEASPPRVLFAPLCVDDFVHCDRFAMPPTRQLPEPPPLPIQFSDEAPPHNASSAIIEELPGAVASVLVELLRELRASTFVTTAERRSIAGIPDTRELPAELARTVDRTFELLREEPNAETREAIGLGLLLVAEWAEVQRSHRTAVVFYHGALTVIPDNVQMAYHIGRLLRRIAMYDEAEAWLLHTVEKAAAAENWENPPLRYLG